MRFRLLAILALASPGLHADTLDAAAKAEIHASQGDFDLAEKEAAKSMMPRAREILEEAREARAPKESPKSRPKPSPRPTEAPTPKAATAVPTEAPSPTQAPTPEPTHTPTFSPTFTPTHTPQPPKEDPALKQKQQEVEEARQKAEAELRQLEEERQKLAEEKRRLELERAEMEGRRKAPEAAPPAGRIGGGISLVTGFRRPRIHDRIYELAGNCSTCTYPPIYDGARETFDFGFPIQFGIGLHQGGWVLENSFNIAEGTAYYPAQGPWGYSEVRGTLVALWDVSAGYDLRLFGSRQGLYAYLPLRLEGGSTWVTVQEHVFFGPHLSLAGGLGAKWRVGPKLELDLSGRYHLGMEVSGLNADNGERYVAGKQEVLTDAGGISLNLGLNWFLW